MTNDRYRKNPATFGPKSVLGIYLRTMNMAQYRDLGYADSDHLIENQQVKQLQEDASIDDEYEAELRRKLEAGEISENEYNTRTKTNARASKEQVTETFLAPNTFGEEDDKAKEAGPPIPTYQIDSSY